MGNASKRQHRANNSRRPPMGLVHSQQKSESKFPHWTLIQLRTIYIRFVRDVYIAIFVTISYCNALNNCKRDEGHQRYILTQTLKIK